jgi:uncharacterized protein (TIGR02246 family)
MNDLESAVRRTIDAYCAAVFDKDVDAFMRLYDADVRVFDTWGVWSYEGADAWRKMIEQWFGSLGNERVNVTMDDVQHSTRQGVVIVTAFTTYAAVSEQGEQLRAMQNRLTWLIEASRDAWKIVHEHTSVPMSFDGAKAILQRAVTS